VDLRNWEFFAGTSAAVTGANVSVYEASLTHPNPNSPLDTAITDGNGMWSFTGLSDTAKDVKVEYSSRIKWYKGLTLHSVYAVREHADDPHVEQNLLRNGGFEISTGASSFSLGTTPQAIFDEWLAYRAAGDTATLTRETSLVSTNSQNSLKCVYSKSTGPLFVYQAIPLVLAVALRGQTISASAQVRQGAASAVRAFISYDGASAGTVYGSLSATTGSFITCEVDNALIPTDVTAINVGVEINVTGTHYIDNVMANYGLEAETFVPRFADLDPTSSATIVEAAPTQDTSPLATILNNLAERARTIIGAAGNDWKDAIPRSLTQLFSDVTTAQSTANTGVTNAATAQTAANAAQSTANTGVTNAATAQGTANTAVSNAATAQGTANTAVSNAATAQGTANTAVSNAATAQATANAAVVRAGDTGLGDMTFAASKTLKWPTQDALKMDFAASGEYQVLTNVGHLIYKTNRYVNFEQWNNAGNNIIIDTTLQTLTPGGIGIFTINGQLVTNSHVQINGSCTVTGVKPRLATGADGQRSLLYANETPVPYFEEYGRAQLLHGEAVVHIPEDFANYVNLESEYFVFVTAEGPAALYVHERTSTDFVVRSFAGDADVAFTWHLVARQGDLMMVERKLRTGDDEPYQDLQGPQAP
jgi:hypothetical protein